MLLISCGGNKGRIRIEGEFRNLNQADFLIYSPDGGFDDIDTLHLLKGRFRKDLSVAGGPFTFTIIYPNFYTLSFVASGGAKVRINGDALALKDVVVTGADSVIPHPTELPDEKLHVGMRLPKVDIIEQSRQPGKYLLIGFWANWRSGASVVNTVIKRALQSYGSDNLCALSYSLDLDQRMRRIGEGADSLAWQSFCDYKAWESPAVVRLGIRNIPMLILLDPQGKIVALGSNYTSDIEPTLRKLHKE